jgi:nitrogen fixation protein NifX
MPKNPLSDAIALRIARAARALPDTDAARLLKVLDDAVGLPPTQKKLATLKVRDLKNALHGELTDIDSGALKEAVAILKGEAEADPDPAPALDAYCEGDMPSSIRVACASNKGEMLDGHFGSARRFLIYQVSPGELRLVDVRDADDTGAEDRNAHRAQLIRDCQVLFVASIGGPAAAKVVKADVHPIKYPDGGSARNRVAQLQSVLGDKAPPWLAKAMGQSAQERIRFRTTEAEA